MADIEKPDLLVVGAGMSGYAAASEAARLGATVIVVDRDPGAAPSFSTALPARAFAAAAARAHFIRNAAGFGIASEEPRINFRRVHEHVAEVTAAIAPDHAPERLAARGVEVVRGEARFADRSTVLVGERRIRARRIILATGARPLPPQIPGLSDVPHFTADTIVHNSRKLSHLLVIGGGPVALALAQAHRRLGSDVTLVEPAPLLPGHDPDLVEIALRRLREEGMTLLESTSVTAVRPRSQGIGILVRAGEGAEQALDVSHIVVVGRAEPDLAALDPHKAGLLRDQQGHLLLSRGVRTRNRRVYAIGGAAGQGGQAALLQARAAVHHCLLGTRLHADALAAPRLVDIDPQLAEIGLGAAAAMQRPGTRVLRIGLAETDRARIERASYGLVKLTVDGAGRLLGAGVVGSGAAELAGLFSLALASRLTLAQLAAFAPPSATLAEAAQALAAADRQGIAASPIESRLFNLIRRLP